MNRGTSSRRLAGQPHCASNGFTLLELLIVVAVVALALIVGIPNLVGQMKKQGTRSFLNEVNTFMISAKSEAVTRGVPVVVELDLANNRLFAFANVDNDAGLSFAPDGTKPNRTVDYETRTLNLPASGNSLLMDFWGPTDATPRGGEITDGLTVNGDGDRVVVFEPDASVRDTGAIRFADLGHYNSFEVRVAPQATGRVQTLKYNPSVDFGGPNFLPPGSDASTGKSLWTWY